MTSNRQSWYFQKNQIKVEEYENMRLTSPTNTSKVHLHGVSVVAPQKQTQLASRRRQLQSMASLSGLRIWHCPEVWCRLPWGLDPTSLWPWSRLASVALIWPLAWELPYTTAAAIKRKTKQTNQKKKRCIYMWNNSHWKLTEVLLHNQDCKKDPHIIG